MSSQPTALDARAERQQLADDIIAWQSGEFGDEVTLTNVLDWHMERVTKATAQAIADASTAGAAAGRRAGLEEAAELADGMKNFSAQNAAIAIRHRSTEDGQR